MVQKLEKIRQLLDKIRLINFKYDKIINTSDYNFNIFSILRNDADEVNLHSQFLCEILSPSGSHSRGTLFLDLFLKEIGIDDFATTNAKIGKEYRQIDILIENGDQSIILENKIYAQDQERQLERYQNTLLEESDKDIDLVYLTLDGREPSDNSRGSIELDDIRLISYRIHIDNWLSACIKESALSPGIRETFIQYQRLVRKLTGTSISIGYIMDIKDLLLNGENISLAYDIREAFQLAKIDIQLSFWQELESKLKEKGYTRIESDFNYTEEMVIRYCGQNRNSRYFGLIVEIGKFDKETDIVYVIEVDYNIFHGVAVIRQDDRNISENDEFTDLAKTIANINQDFERSDWYLGWKYPSEELNLMAFNDPIAFSLADKDARENYIDNLVDDIHNTITILKKDHPNYFP